MICILFRPIIVRHVIDEQSPLHGLTRDTLPHAEFELIMTVEGIVEATGMTFQARTSFLPSEIRWGCRFVLTIQILLKPQAEVLASNFSINAYSANVSTVDNASAFYILEHRLAVIQHLSFFIA